MTELHSKSYETYHKFIYAIITLFVIFARAFGITKNTALTVIAVCVFVLFYGLGILFRLKLGEEKNGLRIALKIIEFIAYNILESFYPSDGVFMAIWTSMLVFTGIEVLLEYSDYDKSTIFIRKITVFIILFAKLFLTIGANHEEEWFAYFLIQLLLFFVLLFIADACVQSNETYSSDKNKLTLELSKIESNNAQLIDYQEKVKSVNEQINYQKIDLARTLRELEQVNIEIESQTEVMKYMASNFDVLKCINVITDAIMDVKKPKLCALFVDKDVYYNKYNSCIIKTNYSSMQRRLKKEIETIFESYSQNADNESVITGEGLKEFKFIGDANINSLAIMTLGEQTPYGLLIVGSDDESFFDKGLNYYETCILEFDVAVKGTKLYLKMEDMARKDGLTGIYNRVYNGELFKQAAKEAAANKEPLSVALFDIDKFKNVNDTYGHLAGDNVIKMVANVAHKYADKYNGFACRYGGEEFLLTLPGYDEEQALSILETMHNEIKATVVLYEDVEIAVNVCIGLSSYPSICSDTAVLVNRADKAMYYGKKHGRGRLIVDNPEIDE